jgi:hypothetical protein
MLDGLHFVPGAMQIDDLTYVENFSITTGSFPPLPHPASSVELPRLNESDLGTSNVAQIFSWRSSRFRQSLLVAREQKLGFALIRYAANASQVELYGEDFRLLASAKRCFDPRNVLASAPDIFCYDAAAPVGTEVIDGHLQPVPQEGRASPCCARTCGASSSACCAGCCADRSPRTACRAAQETRAVLSG